MGAVLIDGFHCSVTSSDCERLALQNFSQVSG